ncbi:MAG: hypothetical protein AB7O97_08065 [Planctomycetota bacterium]
MPRPDRAADLERLQLQILPQPDDFTCGPTCLHSVYSYFGDAISLPDVIGGVPRTPSGGTVAVLLANHALRRGYEATLYTYNIRLFDPTWFTRPGVDIADRLRQQAAFKAPKRPVFQQLTDGFLEFLELGGEVQFVDPSADLLRRYLRRGVPILTGLSSTFLYRHAREYGDDDHDDDIRGEPQGHFVVLCGYHARERSVMVADPFEENPLSPDLHYEVGIERLLAAIMLGVLTHDANLLMIEPGKDSPARPRT